MKGSRSIRILYIFPEVFPNTYARGVQVAHSVCALAEQGAQVDFYHVSAGERDPFLAYGLTKPQGVTCYAGSRRMPGPLAFLPVQSNRFFSAGLLAWLRRRAKTAQAPDVIYVRHLKIAAALLEAGVSTPVVYEAHEVFAVTAKPSQIARIEGLERLVMERAAAVVANSSATANGLKERYGLDRQIFVVTNGVSDKIPPGEKNWDQLGQSIVYAGSFYKWKGADDLVKAAALLPGCRIRLIGGTAEQIQALRKDMPPNGGAVDFVGRLSHDKVLQELSRSCIAVLPNRVAADSGYTCPLKLFEYMMAGCAVVATKIPAITDLVGDDVVIWANPNDPASLANALRYLIENPQLARELGERAAYRAREFTWSARADKLLDLIGEVLGAGGQPIGQAVPAG